MLKMKIYIVLLTIAIMLTVTGSAWGQEPVIFIDTRGNFAENSITYLAEQGMIRGLGSRQFGPNIGITRMQFAVFMTRVLGVQPLLIPASTFSDLTPTSPESGYIEALCRLGIIQGTGNSRFNGNSLVRREDAAVMLQRALGKGSSPMLENSYRDQAAVSSYAVSSVAYVTEQRLMSGNGGCFFPARYLTRAEAVVLAERLLKVRNGQALRELPVSHETLTLKRGGNNKLNPGKAANDSEFTTTYGIDNLKICGINPTSSELTGISEGAATITSNRGLKSVAIPIVVSANESSRGGELPYSIPAANSTLALDYKVIAQSPDSSHKQTEYKNYSGPVEGLTSPSEAWTGFLRQQGRDIVIDLGGLQTVTGISMEFKQDSGAGIYFPKYLTGAVSADGISWYHLGQVLQQISPSDKTVRSVTMSLATPAVNTRYLKLSFPVDVYVFARHLSVQGAGAATQPVVLAPVPVIPRPQAGYLADPAFNDVLLVFTGDQTDIKTLDSQDFLPLVAYLDQEGTVKGRMFDAIQFMPYTGMPCSKASWTAYLDDLFRRGQQLSALDDAMAKSGLSSREKIILTLPYPDPSQNDFGSLDPYVQTLSFSTDKNGCGNRLTAVKWYYGELMKRWELAGLRHLDLAGIYWYQEMIDPRVSGETELVKNVAHLVKAKNHSFVWIPYYGAPGFADWGKYGFTHVFLQPNYYATQDPPEERMDQAAAMARIHNSGMELELDNRVLSTRYYYDLFYNELNKAHEQGLDSNTPNAYYVGFAQTLLDMARSDVPPIRKVYDDIYRWIAGKYK